jgi:hypothetical protein
MDSEGHGCPVMPSARTGARRRSFARAARKLLEPIAYSPRLKRLRAQNVAGRRAGNA